ncbi:MAG: hypothetical protein GY845_29125, partial [Planctomycetes bacterium]|nr:hypothetical protein [Planctomycetota bacterium]
KMRLGNIDGVGGLRAYPDLVKFADYDWSFSSQKAITHLGYRPRSIHTSLRDLLTNNFAGSYTQR